MSLFPSVHFRLEVFEELSSTNLVLMERAQEANFSGSALLAKRQTAGAGRRGRTWQTPSGNLALSYGLSLEGQTHTALYSFVSGIALFDTAQAFLGAADLLSLKWPNDLYLDGRKLAGMLTQARQQGAEVKLVVGIGLNIRAVPEGEVRVPALALAEFLPPAAILPTPEIFAREFLSCLEKTFAACVDFPTLKAEWQKRCKHLGKSIVYERSDGKKEHAIAREILPSGELLVLSEHSGEELKLSSEEVSLQLLIPQSQF